MAEPVGTALDAVITKAQAVLQDVRLVQDRRADRKFKSPFGAAPPAAAAPTSPAGRSGPARAARSQAERGLDMPCRMG
jgi:hypothetical protein